MSTVSGKTADWQAVRCGSGLPEVDGVSITHDMAWQLPFVSTEYQMLFNLPIQPFTMPALTSKFWPIITDMPMTNGIFPKC